MGTPAEIAEVTYSYTPSGKIQYVIDANGNRAELRYDGHDRQSRWVFPSKTRYAFDPSTPATALDSAGPLNETDYEAYTYDANGNRLTLRKRDGSTISYQYDALNRMTRKTTPNRADLASIHERDVFYSYDLRGLQTAARFDSASGAGLTTTYDGFGRIASTRSNLDGLDKTLTYAYDANGNRIRITHFDGQFFRTDYDGLNRPNAIRQNNVTVGSTAYDKRGMPAVRSWTYAAASANKTSLSYDSAGRLGSVAIDINGTSGDVAWSFTRNPASQIRTETQSNDSYSWDLHHNLTRSYTVNGLNQYQSAGPASFCYDENGNVTADGESVYKYDFENRLVERRAQTNTNCAAVSYTGALDASLRYDPLGRLYSVTSSSGTVRYLYDGDARVAEFSGTHALLRRYVHGLEAGADDPQIWYEGSAVNSAARRYLHADVRGSIVAVTNYSGTLIATNTYDEYGMPDDLSNLGAFQYTGQVWLPELNMYYYKARMYSPYLGRFLQTDPVGYEDQVNLYAYVANDPVNMVDPSGQWGWLVKLAKEGVKKVARVSKKDAVRARRQGQNVQARSRQEARQIERQVSDDPSKLMRHKGHDLRGSDGNPTGQQGRSHYQTEGQKGHTFWSAAGALTVLEQALDVVDQLTNPFYVTELGDGTCPASGCGQPTSPSDAESTEPRSRSNWSINGSEITGCRARASRIDTGC